MLYYYTASSYGSEIRPLLATFGTAPALLDDYLYTRTMRYAVLAIALSSMLATAHASPAPNKPGEYWVSAERVQIRAAPDPKAKQTSFNSRGWKMTVFEYLTGSDNFGKFRKVMIKAPQELIANHTCTAEDFKMNGAWSQEPEGGTSQPVYFTCCGSMTSAGRVFLNVRTGKTYK
jgi:hypothetical protein